MIRRAGRRARHSAGPVRQGALAAGGRRRAGAWLRAPNRLITIALRRDGLGRGPVVRRT
ncbi:MAG: hypothetical protein AVDCRST_MAG38-2464 [uncultured Solirubrobacteraceae bacterium]|uniref:Uncharacterized protein n=1 Tax=uncultured Solirubrobacteraceae bacterium TaxID=1162706 RepID=A0A6J4S333_9ACTN|nr:MAG: hypothetical protein AVDCRST_MAG38-2464 [uncultured Solirubrobacteraceae bacterium]